MAQEANTTVQMDSKGRVVIPKPVREALDVEGNSANVSLQVSVNKVHSNDE